MHRIEIKRNLSKIREIKSRRRTGEDERGGGAEEAEEGSSFIAAEGRRHLRFRSNSIFGLFLDLFLCLCVSEHREFNNEVLFYAKNILPMSVLLVSCY